MVLSFRRFHLFFWSHASIGYTPDSASDGVGLGPWRRVGIVNPKNW